jgi:hypothetical protein
MALACHEEDCKNPMTMQEWKDSKGHCNVCDACVYPQPEDEDPVICCGVVWSYDDLAESNGYCPQCGINLEKEPWE